MGLDIYFVKRNNEKYNKAVQEADAKPRSFWEEYLEEPYSPENAEEWERRADAVKRTYIAEQTDVEVAYFRKVNFLMDFFEYMGNCEYKQIAKEEVEALLEACEKELNGEEALTPTAGFFFGSTKKDDYFFGDVERVKERFTAILAETDWEKETVYMYCWW